MKRTLLIFLGILLLTLSSCKKEYKAVDGTSKETFEKSLDYITSKLSIFQQEKMQEAIKLLYKFKTQGTDESRRWIQLYELLNNKNTEQIFDMAEEEALKQKIKWSRTSMPTLEDSALEKPDISEDPQEQALKKIETATKINVTYSPINSDKELNDGFILYPSLIDDGGNIVEFNNLDLNLTISFINKDIVLYVIDKKINSSEVGDPRLKKGIKILYNMFDEEKLNAANVDVEIKLNMGDKYLYGKKTNIPIEMYKTRETVSSLEQEANNNQALDNVKKFIQDIGRKDYPSAYNLSKNPKWGTLEKFSSTATGFGTVEETNLLTIELINSIKDKITIFTLYQIKDKNLGIKTLKQNFILTKAGDNWLITDTETKDVKHNDIWK